MKFRDFIGISKERQAQVSRFLQLMLIVAVIIGIYRKNMGIVVNSLVSLLVTFLPGVLERDYEISMDPALILWLTTAVFLHAAGTLGPYQQIWWWDHLTHTLSSSVVAAAGYAAVRAFDEHYEEIQMPKRFLFAFILVFVMAFGVFWELIEFGISGVAKSLGMKSVLTQYGLEDTMKDLIFDSVGGLIAGLMGEIYLADVIQDVKDMLPDRRV